MTGFAKQTIKQLLLLKTYYQTYHIYYIIFEITYIYNSGHLKVPVLSLQHGSSTVLRYLHNALKTIQ